VTPGPGSKKRTASSSRSTEVEASAADPAAGLSSNGPEASSSLDATDYTVVARRYRPQRFEDVVGQDHVVQALRNALRLNRLAQAYLFCGTRGVGKTSMARIFAKCLNCVHGPTETPCQVCEMCQAIAAGQDVDVIEIDGASNNGVEQVRELRQNVSLRPSRSRFKIYYIDEVHMLSTGAFNALLKTLEEPPPHVKFFFATTEANRIPITVLSRCQRYDFAGITPDAIVNTLKEICAREQMEAETEALQVVARRAGGSMRDAQSLLEQLLASGSSRLTVEVVHALLGTPSDERLLAMLEALADHQPTTVLTLLDEAAAEGVQASDFLAGTLEFLRDAMVLSVGAGSVLLAVTPRQKARLQGIVDRWSTDAILAAMQILAEARARMRGVSHGRLLAELALVRVARLENLTELSDLVQRISAIGSDGSVVPKTTAPGLKKKLGDPEPGPRLEVGPSLSRPASSENQGEESSEARTSEDETTAVLSDGDQSAPRPPLDLEVVRQIWPDLVKKVGMSLGMGLVCTEAVAVEDTDLLVIAPKPGYNKMADICEPKEAREKIGQALQRLLHRPIRLRFRPSEGPARTALPDTATDSRRPDALAHDPMIQKVVELFEARPMHLEYEDDSGSR
jgi:DNA polymerase-3 subunit gamma/tau